MPDTKFDLGDYVEVKDRIRILYELFPQARVVTDYTITSEPDAKPKVIARASVYRRPDDLTPAGTGTSWLYLPGSTPYTKGSEIENAETSAVGRAIGMLGILIDRSIASAQEVANKAGEARAPERTDGGLIGIVEAGDKQTSDYLIRYDPDGVGHVGFRLRGDKGGILVEASGDLAEDLMVVREALVGARVTCWGAIGDRTFRDKNGRTVTYQALALSRLTGPDGLELPAKVDAPTVPLFDDPELDAVAQALPL